MSDNAPHSLSEKSFTDEELKDIMDEIESLEQEFVSTDDDDAVVGIQSAHSDKSNFSNKSGSAASKQEMNFSISGEMAMQLNFKTDQGTLSLDIDGEHGLVISLPNGGNFSFPLNSETNFKKTGS